MLNPKYVTHAHRFIKSSVTNRITHKHIKNHTRLRCILVIFNHIRLRRGKWWTDASRFIIENFALCRVRGRWRPKDQSI